MMLRRLVGSPAKTLWLALVTSEEEIVSSSGATDLARTITTTTKLYTVQHLDQGKRWCHVSELPQHLLRVGLRHCAIVHLEHCSERQPPKSQSVPAIARFPAAIASNRHASAIVQDSNDDYRWIYLAAFSEAMSHKPEVAAHPHGLLTLLFSYSVPTPSFVDGLSQETA